MNRSRNSLLAMLLAAACALPGCGYHFAAEGDALPQGARTIYVKRFANQTRITGLNDELMRYIKDEIALHDRLKLVDDPAQADLELTGTVTGETSQPVNFNSVLEPTLYGRALGASASLIDTHTKKVIWTGNNINNARQTPVVATTVVTTTPSFLQQNLRGNDIVHMTDIQVAQTQTAASKDQVMRQVAKNLYAEMSEGF